MFRPGEPLIKSYSKITGFVDPFDWLPEELYCSRFREMFKVGCALYCSMAEFGHGIVQCTTDLEHLYRIYPIPTHDKHQWLLLRFIVLLMMDAKGVRNM